MKRQKAKISLILLMFLGLILGSCSNNDTTGDGLNDLDLKTAQDEAEVDNISDESSAIIEEAFLTEESPETKSSSTDRYLPDCVTITAVIEQNTKTVTIDFGDGCSLRNGNDLSGKIVIDYERDTEAATKTINYTFDNFYFNSKKVEGGGTILRELSNGNGNPQSTKTFDVSVTWPDGSMASKKGVRIREWIEGFDTWAWGDNVFLITGNWTFTKVDGTVVTAEVTEPLRRELACRFLVSGSMELNRNGNTALIDYGDGTCDDLATVSINGGDPIEIHLSNLR
ncbi:MAG: hypothetical protein KDC69_02580 [Flavobacteriaceae bacterium]|nr:hypothetical protein [Flavobacteriaceae bacterium]MCB0474529.1 hypothetical protein [Flavobacteriaceae bacterium]